MKFLLTTLMAVMAAARPSTKTLEVGKNIKVNSELGNNLMAHARRVEGQDEEIDFTWVADYSIKFQGCHHISQWNEEADGEEDVRIQTKRLVRFRLCPTDYCTDSTGGGCDSGYGEYIIDMNIFLEAYMQAVQNYYEAVCEKLEEGECACENANDDEKCQWDCFVENGVERWCADGNPYEDDEDQVQFELEEYMECANWEPQNNNRRKLNQQIEYFVGPYCSSQGGSIHLGLFTDESCTLFADDSSGLETYSSLTYGETLPYSKDSSESIIDLDCISCKEPDEDDYNNGGNDYQDEDEVIEMCEQIYQQAGKCESYGLSNVAKYPNDNACNYMEGIKIVRLDGGIDTKAASSGGANKTASIFIGIFVVAFVLLAAYVYYLKTKLDRASINLAE